MVEKRSGRYAEEIGAVQVTVPKHIINAVKRKCEENGFQMTTFWRRYILEGFKNDKQNGFIE